MSRRGLLQKIGGAVDNRFIMTVKSDNAGTSGTDQFTIRTNTLGITIAYNYDVETSDGYTASGLTGDHTITFPSGAGTHEVYITGDFPRADYDDTGDKLKILDIKNFGIYGIGSKNQDDAFKGCANMEISATDSGNFGLVIQMGESFEDCSSITSFPLIDTSSCVSFFDCWRDCTSLISFPMINTTSATSFQRAWINCTSLANFPSNVFDGNSATNYISAFQNTNLSQTSIDNILVSIAASYTTNGLSGGTFQQSGGSAPSATGEAAIDTLRAAGMTVTVTGGY